VFVSPIENVVRIQNRRTRDSRNLRGVEDASEPRGTDGRTFLKPDYETEQTGVHTSDGRSQE